MDSELPEKLYGGVKNQSGGRTFCKSGSKVIINLLYRLINNLTRIKMNNNLKRVKLLFVIAIFAFSCTQQVSKNPPGYPDRSPELDVLPGFQNPPKGYGNVAFYW